MKQFQISTVNKGKFKPGLFGVDEAYTGVLTALGLPADKVEALKGVTAETLKDFNADDYVAPIRTNLETSFLNDPNFLGKLTKEKIPEALRKDIESGQYGRFMNEFKDYATKTLGLDLSDLTQAEETSLRRVAEKVTAKYAGKLGTPEAIKTLQADLTKALGDKTNLEQTHAQQLKEAVDNAKTSTNELVLKLLTQQELASIEGLSVSPSLIGESIVLKAKSLYSLKLDGTEVVVRRKDNPELDAMNTDGTKKTFAQVISEITKAEKGLIKEETKKKEEGEGTAGAGGATGTEVTVKGTTVKLPGNIAAKVNENMKAEGSGK